MNIVQQRINELEQMRNRLEITQPEDGTWGWWLDREIAEIKNARLAGRTLSLRTRLRSLVLSIVAVQQPESKGERA
ncbi:hypothetical protein [Paenibacillus massiliensis]|uniref:hypothetical protein n=1 Tax=Paenibacillus massiliensis TaxID=225917 RepID=UPI00042A4B6C|nr:hypothetical protein [Paenibacillus massiliensis]